MEKHWSSVVSRSVCDYFFEAQTKATSAADLPPVISTPHYYLVSIFRHHLYFVAVLQNEGVCVCAWCGMCACVCVCVCVRDVSVVCVSLIL